MKNLKTFAKCIMLVGMSLMIIGCDKGPAIEETMEETKIPVVDLYAERDPMPTRELHEVTDRWQDLTFSVDGVGYGFPLAYSELVDAGWTFNLEDYGVSQNYIMNPGDKTTLLYLTNPAYPDQSSNQIRITLTNPTNTVQDIKDCVSYYFSADFDGYTQSFADKSPEFKLACGITRGSKVSEIIAAYGQPTFSNSDGTTTYMQYEEVADNILVMNLTVHNELGLTDIVLEKFMPGNGID